MQSYVLVWEVCSMSTQRPTPFMYILPHSFLHVALKDLTVFLSFLTPPDVASKWLVSCVHALLQFKKQKKKTNKKKEAKCTSENMLSRDAVVLKYNNPPCAHHLPYRYIIQTYDILFICFPSQLVMQGKYAQCNTTTSLMQTYEFLAHELYHKSCEHSANLQLLYSWEQ